MKRPQTYAELVAEAKALFTPEKVAQINAPIHPAFGRHTVEQLIKAHIAMSMTPAIQAELKAARRAEYRRMGWE